MTSTDAAIAEMKSQYMGLVVKDLVVSWALKIGLSDKELQKQLIFDTETSHDE